MSEKLQEAVLLYNKGDKAQALKLLAEIVKQEPNNSVAWYGLALCLDDLDKKVYCLKRVLSLDPSHKKAQQLLERLQIGKNSENHQKATESQPLPMAKKEMSFSWQTVSILGISGVTLMCLIIIGASFLNKFLSAPISYPTNIPATHPPIIVNTHLPSPTVQPTLLPGPARRYVPITNEGMPSNYIDPIIDEYRLDDGDYYRIKFQALDSGYQLLLDEPSYFFSAFASNTDDDAIKKYRETSQSYQVDSNDWKYDWSKNTYSSSLFDESGQYIGYKDPFAEVGRVIRVNNVIVLIAVKIRNLNGVTSSDINRIQQDLDKLTKIVEQKFR